MLKPPALLTSAALAALLALAGCGKSPQAAATQPTGPAKIPVRVVAVEGRSLQRRVHVVGSLAGLEELTISNKVAGPVDKVLVEVGARVKPNQELAVLEPDRFNMALSESKQSVTQALERLGLPSLPPLEQSAEKVEGSTPVKRAKAELEAAQNKADRAKPLHDTKVMQDFEFLDIMSALDVAKQNVNSARHDAAGMLEQARINQTGVGMREWELHNTTVRTPDGSSPSGEKITSYSVVERNISTGEYLKEGTPMFRLIADGLLKLRARVPERELSRITLGKEVRFHVEAYPDQTFIGTVRVLDPSIDKDSRTFLVEAYVPNNDGKLRPGAFVEGDIIINTQDNVPMLPVESLVSFAGVTRAFILQGSDPQNLTAKQLQITAGQQEEISSPGQPSRILVEALPNNIVKPGDLVVRTGQSKLFDGAPVERLTDEPATSQAAPVAP